MRARPSREAQIIVRDDFWTSTSNKQLNFVQHVKTILQDQRPGGHRRAGQRALRGRRGRDGAPQAAARVRRPHPAAPAHRHLLRPGRQGQRALLRPQAGQRDAVDEAAVDLRPAHQHALHPQDRTRSRAPTWTSSSPATTRTTATSAQPTWSETNPDGPLARLHLRRTDRRATRSTWTSSGCGTRAWKTRANLPDPDVLAREIVEDLQAALEQFSAIAEDLGNSDAANCTFPSVA